jgi:hypothetical protein
VSTPPENTPEVTDSERIELDDAENGILDESLGAPCLWTRIELPDDADPSMRWDQIAQYLEGVGAVPPPDPFQEEFDDDPVPADQYVEESQVSPSPVIGVTESNAGAQPSSDRPRLKARLRDGFALAAASGEHPRYVETWPRGRLIRQQLGDGTISLTVEYEDTAQGTLPDSHGSPRMMRLRGPSDATQPFHLLVILLPTMEAADSPAQLVGHAIVADLGALGELDLPELLSPIDLGAAELAVLPDSVAAARGAWDTAWRHAARAAGKESSFYKAVLRGTRRA